MAINVMGKAGYTCADLQSIPDAMHKAGVTCEEMKAILKILVNDSPELKNDYEAIIKEIIKERENMEMKVGLKYIVIKASDDKSFIKGDHISMGPNGDILCDEAEGWMPSENVKDAIMGMEFILDKNWAIRKRERLLKELQNLEQGE